LLSGVVAVSTGAIFARLADAHPLVIAAYRSGISVLILLPFAWWKARREIFALSRLDLGLAALSGFFLAMHFALWITSLDYTSVANSVVLVNTNPVWVALLAPLLTRDRVSRTVLVSVAISVTGGVIIAFGDFAIGAGALRGDLLALGGSLFGALYLLAGRNIRARVSLLAYVTVCYGMAALILWGGVLALRLPVTGYSTGTVAAFVGLAVVSQVVGHTSFNWALKWFSASIIAVSLLGEPVLSTIMAFFLFGEGLTWLKLLGGALILTGIYIAARGTKDIDLADEGAL
jgi:drug/metabolite transporter (DMT)-like permease